MHSLHSVSSVYSERACVPLQVSSLFWLTVAAGRKEECIEPENKDEVVSALRKEIFRDILLGRGTLNIIPEYRRSILAEYDADKKSASYRDDDGLKLLTYLVGESKCRRAVEETRRSCPHYVVMDYDEHREPASIAKSMCACTRCMESLPEMHAMKTSRCQPVPNYVPVIRRVCHRRISKFYRYIRDLELAPVGCTCVLPS